MKKYKKRLVLKKEIKDLLIEEILGLMVFIMFLISLYLI
jgi:hypothetical protein